MSVLELAFLQIWQQGLALVAAFTLATLAVALLRPLCRRAFGAERAFLLWLLPPLALLACLLPHPEQASLAALPLVPVDVALALAPVHQPAATGADWRIWAVAGWLLGAVLAGLAAAIAQRRYRRVLRDARTADIVGLPCPVLLAQDDAGPALIGAWRPRIVLPVDFHHRYASDEQALVLAHEAMHARRGDGCWALVAQVLSSTFWFHPLAWWARAALRRDLELAYDAAVLRERGSAQRRCYADAMLKTQLDVRRLPVGCNWSSHHPLKERIAMLKQPLPTRRRRAAGLAATVLAGAVLSGLVYAASAPLPTVTGGGITYQLDLAWLIWTDDGHGRHEETASVALCDTAGKPMQLKVRGWTIGATVTPVTAGHVRTTLRLDDAAGTFATTQLQGALDAPLHAEGTGRDGRRHYALDVTPSAGCPATASASNARITLSLAKVPARTAALAIAARSGLRLADPRQLDRSLVSFRFDDVQAASAMRYVADVDGRRMSIDQDGTVRFAPK